MKNKIEERLKREMEGKTKSRAIKEDKWKMKEYIVNCNGEGARDIMLNTTYVKSTNELQKGNRFFSFQKSISSNPPVWIFSGIAQ